MRDEPQARHAFKFPASCSFMFFSYLRFESRTRCCHTGRQLLKDVIPAAGDVYFMPLRRVAKPGCRIGIMEKKMETTIMENQMEKKIENETDTKEYMGVVVLGL